MRNHCLRLGLGLLLALAAGGSAHAHAFLDRAAPSVGSTLNTSPTVVRLWFTQAIEPAFSAVEITNAQGTRVDDGQPIVDDKDGTLLQIGLKALTPGEYRVNWYVISVDTHRTEGHFTFRVAR